ncbi:hypothetical protein AB205_0201780 [Aquarana catesbeiana]|uniref:Uncharacterized protein n=1 Tax=Aquarana catesbeiana TaxID=8400 RepID=A0A2G9RMB9_AQUCT|nr:hypothetical protein AB205_0201780 [Aquarana catesbeiana]
MCMCVCVYIIYILCIQCSLYLQCIPWCTVSNTLQAVYTVSNTVCTVYTTLLVA